MDRLLELSIDMVDRLSLIRRDVKRHRSQMIRLSQFMTKTMMHDCVLDESRLPEHAITGCLPRSRFYHILVNSTAYLVKANAMLDDLNIRTGITDDN